MTIHHSTSATGAVFGIKATYGDTLPTSGHRTPPDGALTLTSNDGHGHKSAHRALARSLGFGTKEAEYRAYNMSMALIVHTYWTR